MILGVLLEHDFIKDENGRVWSKGVIDYEYLKRYLNVFEKVIVCARIKCGKNENEKKEYILEVSGDNVDFVELPYALNYKDIIKRFFDFRKSFKNVIKKADKIIIRGPSIISLMLYKMVCNKKKFAVEFVMGAEQILTETSLIRKFANKFLNIMAKDMCIKANGVAYVTREKLQCKYPSFSIKYGNDNLHFDTYYSSIDLPESKFYKRDWKKYERPEIFKLVHIGSMQNDRKGQKRLINILDKLIKEGYSVNLLFVGDGKLLEDLKKYSIDKKLEKYIEFKGNISNTEVFNVLSNADLFVLPSSSEGLPRSIIEAMATSLPCVASNVDGIPELVEDEYLCEYDNIDGYVKNIKKFLDNIELMRVVGEKNYFKSKQYSRNELMKRRNIFYEKLKNI